MYIMHQYIHLGCCVTFFLSFLLLSNEYKSNEYKGSNVKETSILLQNKNRKKKVTLLKYILKITSKTERAIRPELLSST